MGNLYWIIIIIVLGFGALIALYIVNKKATSKGAAKVFEDLMENAFTDRVNRFKALGSEHEEVRALLIGDSLIQEYPHDELFKEECIVNRGIGGDTSEGVLNRLNETFGTMTPEKVILLIGTNDLVGSISKETIVSNIRKIVESIHALNDKTKINVLSLLPVNQQVDAFTVGVRTNDTIDAINEKLKSQKTGYAFHDVNSLLSDEKGCLKASLTRDGLHINVDGYRVLTDYIKTNILN